jgi:hypothetical protein
MNPMTISGVSIKAHKVFLSAILEKGLFRATGDSVRKSLKAAAKELDTPLSDLIVAFSKDYCARAETILALAEISRNEVIEFQPAIVDAEKMILCVKEGKSSQTINLYRPHRIEKGIREGATSPTGRSRKKFSLKVIQFDFETSRATESRDPWIRKAVASRNSDFWMRQHWGDFATDGYRIHTDTSKSRVGNEEVEVPKKNLEIASEIRKSFKWGLMVNAKSLALAIKGAKAVKGNEEWVTLEFRASSIVVSGQGAGTGKAKRTVHAKEMMTTRPSKFPVMRVKPKYLLDALSGMKGIANIQANESKLVVRITEGCREAIVMAMRV